MYEIIKNEVTGDEMKIYRSSLAHGGDVLELDVTLAPYNCWSKFPHYHPYTTETFKAVKGKLCMVVGDEEVKLSPEDEKVVITPNMIHCFWNDTDEYVTFHSVISPVGNIEKGIRATYALANAGRMNKMNLPSNVFELAILGLMLDGYSPKMPWQIQKAGLSLLAAIGTALGYRSRFQKLIQKYSSIPF